MKSGKVPTLRIGKKEKSSAEFKIGTKRSHDDGKKSPAIVVKKKKKANELIVPSKDSSSLHTPPPSDKKAKSNRIIPASSTDDGLASHSKKTKTTLKKRKIIPASKNRSSSPKWKKKAIAKKKLSTVPPEGFEILEIPEPQEPRKGSNDCLPSWMTDPQFIPMGFEGKPLSDVQGIESGLVHKLELNGVTNLFPVQALVIPEILKSCHNGGFLVGAGGYRPRDICCAAPTGSGKTLAFILPIVQVLSTRIVCHIRALVVLPTSELAKQVFEQFQIYCKDTVLKVGLLSGLKSFQAEQASLISDLGDDQLDIVVATPGRLVEHLKSTPGFSLQYCRFLVIDEADRLMGEVKHDWLSAVEQSANQKTGRLSLSNSLSNALKFHVPFQKLLFSATLSNNPQKLAALKLYNPLLFTSSSAKQHDASKYTLPNTLTAHYVEVKPEYKPLILLHLMSKFNLKQVLCFANTLRSTNRLSRLVEMFGGIKVKEISSRVLAPKRKRLFNQFAQGKIDLLICSDLLARGMSLDNVQCVVEYDAPQHLETHVHRVGRCARAGQQGLAFTLLERKEVLFFKKTMKGSSSQPTELRVHNRELKPMMAKYESALLELQSEFDEKAAVGSGRKRARRK